VWHTTHARQILTAGQRKPWITPSLFDNTGDDEIVDEYTFGQILGPSEARQILEQHWNTWIVEDDFRAMAAAGLNHVR
jgi:glucan 1,3-beta-glucosidase